MTIKIKVSVVIPHRISGFFEIVDKTENGINLTNPEKIGSRGAGFNLSAVGKTEIIIEKSKEALENECKVYLNNEEVNQKAETTYYIYEYFKNHMKTPINIRIDHKFDLPVGCGFGASGSGALGTVIGLSELLDLKLTYKEKGRIAHISEVINKTGLGTVCGILKGGLSILREPGYPCVSEQIMIPKGLRVVCGTFGVIHTKSILNDPELNLKIKTAGKTALQKLINEKSVNTFVKVSQEFVEEIDIINILNLTKIKELLQNLNRLNIIGASMNQLGRSVFALCKEENVNEVIEQFNCFKPEIQVFNLYINTNKPIIIKNGKFKEYLTSEI